MKETEDTLISRLALAQAEMPHAEMRSDNPYFKSKYAGLPEVIDATKPYLNKYGIAVVQTSKFYPRSRGEDGTEFPPIITLCTQLFYKDQQISSEVPLMYKPNDIQSLISAKTYSKRTELQSVCVVGGEVDDDGNAAAGKKVDKKVSKPTKAAKPSVPAKTEAELL
jgi:hypothetical protein